MVQTQVSLSLMTILSHEKLVSCIFRFLVVVTVIIFNYFRRRHFYKLQSTQINNILTCINTINKITFCVHSRTSRLYNILNWKSEILAVEKLYLESWKIEQLIALSLMILQPRKFLFYQCIPTYPPVFSLNMSRSSLSLISV